MPHLPVMKWNFKEELVASSKQVVLSGGSPETTYYQYDSKGKRLRKITELAAYTLSPAAQKDQRVYIEGFEYYEDFVSTDTTETLSLIDASAGSAQAGNRFVMIENSSVYGLLTRYIHPNHQGSCTLETDDNGDIITYEEYHPFGTTSYQAKNSTITAAAKRYRYTGMERDDETGLNYHNARYYVPWLGRWLNPDPIGIGDGVNVYAYCQNNPVKNTDKEGRQTDEIVEPEIGMKKDIAFPSNPKDGQEFIHYNKEQNTNWGYVYDKSKGWIGTGASVTLPAVEITGSYTPKGMAKVGADIADFLVNSRFVLEFGGKVDFGVAAGASFKAYNIPISINVSAVNVQNPVKLTTLNRFKLTTSDRFKLTTPNRVKLTS